MYTGIKHLHSTIPYILLGLLVISALVFWYKHFSKKAFTPNDKKLALFTFIFAHLQLTIGILMYIISPIRKTAFSSGELMSNPDFRLYAIEHPISMIIAIVLITVGYSKAKKIDNDSKKIKTLGIFYLLGLLFALARIPWDVWPN